MECPEGCGYTLNFPPDFAGRFKGEPWKPLITTEYDPNGEYLWRVRTVHYAPLHKMVEQRRRITEPGSSGYESVTTRAVSTHKMQQGE